MIFGGRHPRVEIKVNERNEEIMMRFWNAVMEEPLIPFALIGGLLFVAFGILKPAPDQEVIEVKESTIEALTLMQQELAGRELSDQERQEIVEGYIEEEVLLREAFRMGLEKKDSRVRKRLLTVMRSTIDQPVSQPSRAELEAYFNQNREKYEQGEVVGFEHVFYAFGTGNEPTDPLQIRKELEQGNDPNEYGDSNPFGRVFRDRSYDQIRRGLGRQVADFAFSIPQNKWQGPIESEQGIHYLKVTSKGPSPPPKFEQLEEYLRQDWMFRKRRESQTEKIAQLRKRYRIAYQRDK